MSTIFSIRSRPSRCSISVKTGLHAPAYSSVSNLSLCDQPSADVFCGLCTVLTSISFQDCYCSALHPLWTTMASADFLQFNLPSLIGLFLCDIPSLLSGTPVRPPRVRAITFLPCNRCIYCMELGQYWTLFCLANSSIPIQPYMQFLFVGSGFCRRLPSDSTSRWTPLP